VIAQLEAFALPLVVPRKRRRLDVHFSSARDDHETPRSVFDALNAEFRFTVDACASKSNALCARFWTRKENAIRQAWEGERVWCNPPYGPKLTAAFIWKAHQAVTLEGCELVTMLIPSRTDTRAFHDAILEPGHEVRFVRGRLRFGGAKNSAPFPSVVVVFRPLVGVRASTRSAMRWGDDQGNA
jgi:site-specific DNA-methyltransferase (adenine-specific)